VYAQDACMRQMESMIEEVYHAKKQA